MSEPSGITPEAKARQEIDVTLAKCGWVVQDRSAANLTASRGVALRELAFRSGEPDYTLLVDGWAIDTVEAKPEGFTLTGIENRSVKCVREKLIERDKVNLDLTWIRDQSLADGENLPDPDVIAQEIVEDLRAALEEFEMIQGDLNQPRP